MPLPPYALEASPDSMQLGAPRRLGRARGWARRGAVRIGLVFPVLAWAVGACAQERPGAGPASTVDASTVSTATVTVDPVTVPPLPSEAVSARESPAAMSAAIATTSPSASTSASSRDDRRCSELHAKPYPEIGAGSDETLGPMTLGRMGNADTGIGKALATMAAGFRRCFNEGLACDDEMHGTTRIEVKLDARGHVVSAKPERARGLSQGVLDCLTARVKKYEFDPPAGGPTTFKIPVSFQRAG